MILPIKGPGKAAKQRNKATGSDEVTIVTRKRHGQRQREEERWKKGKSTKSKLAEIVETEPEKMTI